MKILIAAIGIGGWYPAGVARLVERFYAASPGFEIMAWTNSLPPGAPENVVVDGYDYTAYCAKPFALAECRRRGADIAILLDAAFWPIRPIHPLIHHIQQWGYFLCRNGFQVGQWCADSALPRLGITRDQAMTIPEASSYCVGIGSADARANKALDEWCGLAADRVTFPGRHTAGASGRNHGFVSHDPRVQGHRHDQTALSVIAWRLGLDILVPRPKLTAYDGTQTDETVLVNRGGM